MLLLSPPIVLAVVIAGLYAAVFNLWRNGTPRDLIFYFAAAGAGFAVGQIAGWLIHIDWGMIGSLYLIEGSVFAWLLLLVMNWLRMPKTKS